MSAPHLLIVDPAVVEPERGGVQKISRRWPGAVTVLRPALAEADDPRRALARPADAIVLMGSSASVCDETPWIAALSEWIGPWVDGSGPATPLFGICFGHQLIAHRAGGRVGALASAGSPPLRAVIPSRLDGCRLLPGRREFPVVASHREIVTEAPPGWEIVGVRDRVPIDALQHPSRPVFSFQFHPEAGEEFARRRGIDPRSLGSAPEDGMRLVEAFLRLALSRRAYP